MGTVAGWGRPAGVSLSVYPHIRTLSVHPRGIPISGSEGKILVL